MTQTEKSSPNPALKPETADLLQKTSKEAHNLKKNIHRNTSMVSWSEVEPLLEIAMRNESFHKEADVFIAIGYASPNITEWKDSGQVALRIKWALKGLIAELGGKVSPPAPRIFSFNELTTLMAAMATGTNISLPENRLLMAKIGREISDSHKLEA